MKAKVSKEPIPKFVAGVDPISPTKSKDSDPWYNVDKILEDFTDPIPTPTITTSASSFFDTNVDYIPSSYAKYAKKNVHSDEDEEMEDEYYERPIHKYNYTPPGLKIKSESIEDLTSYISTRNLSSLLKYLVKLTIIHESSNSMAFDPAMMTLDELRAHQGRQISTMSRAYLTTVTNNIPPGVEFDTKTCNLDIITVLEQVYLLPHHKKILFYLDSRDTLNQIIRECALRGIGIDPLITSGKFDFDFLRMNNSSIKLAYFGNINELFLVYDSYSTMFNNIPIYSLFEQIPVIKKLSEENILDKVISINGKDYSKKMVESMIECDFDTLLENLEVEKYLSNLELIESGNIANLEDIKLI